MTLVHALLAIAVPFSLLSSYATPFELEYSLTLSDVTRLFVQPKLLPMALSTASKVGIPHSRIYALGEEASGRKSLSEMINQVRVKRMPRLAVRPAKRDTLAYLIFSSGTSGLPKGERIPRLRRTNLTSMDFCRTAVMISHGNLTYTFMQNDILTQEMAKMIPVCPLGLSASPSEPDIPQCSLISFRTKQYQFYSISFPSITPMACSYLRSGVSCNTRHKSSFLVGMWKRP